MSELKDDCFAYGGDLTPFLEAMAALDGAIKTVVGTETVSLAHAFGRTLAQDLTAPMSVPPHDNAAVDGYAVFFDDLNGAQETRLPILARIAAGHAFEGVPARGQAWRIFTGAPMPKNADGVGPDTVLMQEDCVEEDGMVILPPGIKQGANRRFAGEDVTEGSVMLKAGQRLRAQDVGLAASVGFSEVPVFQPLRAAVFSTGDEVLDPAAKEPLASGQIYDANRYTVMGLLGDLGVAVTDLGILPDEADAIEHALETAARDHDVILTSGGVSQGEEDHIAAVIEKLGSLHFWRIAIKPGRPIALGQIGSTTFVGLPGNPVASMVTFMMIARPVLLRLGGRQKTAPVRLSVPLAGAVKKKTGRLEWMRGVLVAGKDGRVMVERFAQGGAGILTSMVVADGLIELAEDAGNQQAGALVDFISFSEVAT